MKTLRVLVTAFLAGVVLASCKAPTVTCTVTGVDTTWVRTPSGDSLPAIVRTEWCA